jgi:hypothetical protein
MKINCLNNIKTEFIPSTLKTKNICNVLIKFMVRKRILFYALEKKKYFNHQP